MNNKLNLDFELNSSKQHRAGWAVLLFGLLVAVAVGLWFQQICARTEYLQSQVDLASDTKTPSKRGLNAQTSKPDEAELARVGLVVKQLKFPWGPLFTAIENAHNKDIQLFSLKPEMQKGFVRITADATDKAAMLDYLQRLTLGGLLTDAHLVNHQEQGQTPGKPLRFTVEASFAS